MFPYGDIMTEKEFIIYKAIQEFIKNNNYSPSIRELCTILGYKSTKSIYNYLKRLKNKNYLNYEKKKKRSISITNTVNQNVLIINTKKIVNFQINSNQVIYQIKNNYFKDYSIKSNDYLIINTEKKIKVNELGLFIIDKKYQIMKYNYIDGFYILENNKKEVLNEINLVGVVEGVFRFKI